MIDGIVHMSTAETYSSEPGETECWEAIWSQGRACKKCNVSFDCYRKGWEKWQADADNLDLVLKRGRHARRGQSR